MPTVTVEKGHWSPILIGDTGGVATATTAAGMWARSGDIVHASLRLVVPSVAGLTGQLCIEGLPIAADIGEDVEGRNAAHTAFWTGFSLGSGFALCGFMQDATRIRLYSQSATNGKNPVTPAMVSGQITLYLSVTYICHTPTEFETKVWERIAAPVFTPSVDPADSWEGGRVYAPTIVTDLGTINASPDPNGDLLMYYISAATFDQSGLAVGPDLDHLVRVPANPVLPLSSAPAFDCGDTQIMSGIRTATGIVGTYQGNANPVTSGGDDVTLGLFTSDHYGRALTKMGQVILRGPNGDSADIYAGRIGIDLDGLPRIFGTGQDAAGVRGLMGWVSPSGNILGPYTRISDNHLFRHCSTWCCCWWVEDGLIHLLYCPIHDNIGGVWYATSADGEKWVQRRRILERNPGHWDSAPLNCSYIKASGAEYLVFGSSSNIGIGYVREVTA